MLGAFLAILAAASFGLNSATVRRAVISGTVIQGLAVTVPLGVPLFALGCAAVGGFAAFADLSWPAWGWMALAGVVHFVIGRYSNYRATRALGATQSGPVLQVSVLVALIAALVLLGEQLTPVSALGIVLVIVGPLIIVWSQVGRGEVRTRSGIRLNYLEGYFWGVLAATCYGISPLFIRLGLEGGGVVKSLAGGLVSYLAATATIAAVILFSRNVAHVRRLGPGPAVWFAASGVLVFLSQLFRYSALAVAPVSVVIPIQQTSVVFRVLFSFMINREHEVFGASVLLGIALSALGVTALTIGDQLLELVPLPAAIADIARLRWP